MATTMTYPHLILTLGVRRTASLRHQLEASHTAGGQEPEVIAKIPVR